MHINSDITDWNANIKLAFSYGKPINKLNLFVKWIWVKYRHFEQTGKILQLIPIQLTKEDNEDWDETDLEKIREKIVGRHINMPFDFDPDVDAVTSATITSLMIFKSLDDGQNLFRELKEKGLL